MDDVARPLQAAWLTRRSWLLPIAVFVCVLAFRAQFAQHSALPDDAFITYRYAANLAAGDGFVYNRGDRVLGTTTPLLTVLLALARCAGADIVRTAQALSVIASAASVALLVALALATTGSVPAALGAGLFLGLSTYQARIGAGGMEPPLLMALMIGSMLLLVRERFAWGALLAALAALTRPEGFLWWAVYGLYLLWTGKLTRPVLAAGLAPVAVWCACAVAVFGSPLPHTVVAKALQGQSMIAATWPPETAFRMALGPPRYLLVMLAAPLLMWRHDRRLAVPLAFGALFVGGYLLARPMMYEWYSAPLDAALGLVVVAVLDGALRLWDAPAAPRERRPYRFWTLCVLASFLLLVSARAQCHWKLMTHEPPGETRREVARTLGRYTTPADLILVGDIGTLGYYNLDRRLVDYYGLVWKAPRDVMRLAAAATISPQLVRQTIATVQPTVFLDNVLMDPNMSAPGFASVHAPDLPGWVMLRRVQTAAPSSP